MTRRKTQTRSQRWTEWMRGGARWRRSGVRPRWWRKRGRRSGVGRWARLQDAALADDVASRMFINAWNAAGSYDPAKSNAGTWIYTIADRLIVSTCWSSARGVRGG